MAKKTKADSAETVIADKKTPTKAVASTSKLKKGTGSRRVTRRIITVYGPPKNRKTTAVAKLPAGRTKWIVSDSNCIPTLRAINRLPHEDDIYEVNGIPQLRETLEEWVSAAEAAVEAGEKPEDALGIDFAVIDSLTQFSEWHQQDISKATGQKFLGDNQKENGWQRFNAEFGSCLDLVVALSRYVTVVMIVHAKPKQGDMSKGAYSSFSLTPAMAEKVGRMSNWILLKSFQEVIDDAKAEKVLLDHDEAVEKGETPDPYFEVIEERGKRKVFESIFYTRTTDGWIAACNAKDMLAEEPGEDLTYLLEKDGLL